MNDFVNAAEAPDFDTAGIVRRARRKRATAIAGIATALIVAGGGTALASINSGSDTSKPAAAGTVTADPEAAYVALEDSKYKLDFRGLSLDFAQQLLLKAQLKLGKVGEVDCGKNGKPGTVVEVSPHSPTAVPRGASINLTLCAG
ncbi:MULTISPECIES: PASTA domain-containing protein [unclassified Streptomyces]|uniref:PASTA domain-containing protein n=1 Tax=unclassified Streptomyces TaxID=2593676 RepID=UPI001CC29A54|nr:MULTISPECIES: PASTA domain-containing protein [unclassified Streptomyces]